MWKSFLFAVSFLTRLPLPASVHEVDEDTLAKGPAYFPLVGALIGLATGLVIIGLTQFLGSLLSVVLALAIEARLTGAMHEDALADSADALGGGWTRERTLEIFKDSRLGTYGVLALGLGVAIRVLALAGLLQLFGRDSLDFQPVVFLLIVATAGFVGRFQMLIFILAVPPIPGRTSLSGDFAGGVTSTTLWALSIVPTVLIAIAAGGEFFPGQVGGVQVLFRHSVDYSQPLLALVLCGFLHLVFCPYIKQKLGGSTGDVLGAVAFVSQVLVLVAFGIH